MFARRGAGVFLRRLQAQACSLFGATSDDIVVRAASQSTTDLLDALVFGGGGARYHTESFWDVPSSPAKEALHIELQTTRGMLPHRGNFFVQFNPHGVHLMPTGVRLRNISLRDAWDEESVADAPVMADSVKRKRRVKIKKHKVSRVSPAVCMLDCMDLLLLGSVQATVCIHGCERNDPGLSAAACADIVVCLLCTYNAVQEAHEEAATHNEMIISWMQACHSVSSTQLAQGIQQQHVL